MSTQPLDHGILSGTRRTSTARQRRHDDAKIERSIDVALAEVKAEQEAAQAEARAAYAKRNTPVPFTMDQLKPGGIIRTSVGLYRVLKVNAKTVRVEPADAFDFNSFRIDQILEVLK